MFARASSLILFILFALPLFVAAGVVVPRTDPPVNQCNSGAIKCCNNTAQSNSALVTTIAGLLGVVLGPITQLVGLQCTGVVGGQSCSNQAVCCSGNTYNGGVLVLGCSPININL